MMVNNPSQYKSGALFSIKLLFIEKYLYYHKIDGSASIFGMMREERSLKLNLNLQSSRKTFWPTSHSDFLSCRIQESECKFTGPNKAKNNFTCLLLYQLAANRLFSHKNIKLFLQWLLSTKGYQFSISRFSNAN